MPFVLTYIYMYDLYGVVPITEWSFGAPLVSARASRRLIIDSSNDVYFYRQIFLSPIFNGMQNAIIVFMNNRGISWIVISCSDGLL